MDTDRNLLFGVLALQADLIDAERFTDACIAWSSRKGTPLAAVLVERGWITEVDRGVIERLMSLKLARYDGNARASLAAVVNEDVKRYLDRVRDDEIHQSIDAQPNVTDITESLPVGEASASTINLVSGSRDRYTFTRLHATGGIGRIWLARDGDLGREVALKELRPDRACHAAIGARFFEEARITGQLEHPNIVPVYELVRSPEERQSYYTMRFVKGRTLAEASRAHHQTTPEAQPDTLEFQRLLTAFVAVCNAVAYAHSRGVIHRDLKGQNVVIGDYGEVIVLDWGLAKLKAGQAADDAHAVRLDDRHARGETLPGQILGTPAYMSPEQAKGRWDTVDSRTDVYSLGAILYEILTGAAPFDGHDTHEVLRAVINDPPRSPRSRDASVPQALEAVCLKALAKQPEQRYESAAALADEIKRFQANEPVVCWREPWTTRTRRWLGKHRVLVGSATAASLAIFAGLVMLAVVQARANRRLGDSNAKLNEARRVAENRVELALKAIDRFRRAVAENDEISNRAELAPLRKKLLQEPLGFYQQLRDDIRSHGETSPSSFANLATSELGLAEITQELGSVSAALDSYRDAVSTLEPLVAHYPDVVDYRVNLSWALCSLGLMQQLVGQLDDAEANMKHSLRIREELASSHRSVGEYQNDLAITHTNLGMLLGRSGRMAEALAALRRGVALGEDLVNRFPKNAQYRIILSNSAGHLGIAERHTGNVDAGLAAQLRACEVVANRDFAARTDDVSFSHACALVNLANTQSAHGRASDVERSQSQARGILEDLARRRPAFTKYRISLAQLLNNIGLSNAEAGRTQAGFAALNPALDLLTALAREHPDSLDFRRRLSMAYVNRGMLYGKTGRTAKAISDLNEARKLLESLLRDHPSEVESRSVLGLAWHNIAMAYRESGEPEKALEPARRAIEAVRSAVQAAPTDAIYRRRLESHEALRDEILKDLRQAKPSGRAP